ncbi:hypothetical protein EW146_g689 [Bondarzewia mesenterica]|uniref:Uncharacterized protein n=1 Tax=Bondarzewia mesenterica TaxID=1095465 RepID=A0A4S4M664_9AGAM|nr:hypothetical protein EW146_g689 [Bondarzewia mesenterica]
MAAQKLQQPSKHVHVMIRENGNGKQGALLPQAALLESCSSPVKCKHIRDMISVGVELLRAGVRADELVDLDVVKGVKEVRYLAPFGPRVNWKVSEPCLTDGQEEDG